jgi:hypothetical protein
MDNKQFSEGAYKATLSGEISLYKNGRQIRKARFSRVNNATNDIGRGRKQLMKEMLQYSDTHLNNYYFIVNLD